MGFEEEILCMIHFAKLNPVPVMFLIYMAKGNLRFDECSKFRRMLEISKDIFLALKYKNVFLTDSLKSYHRWAFLSVMRYHQMILENTFEC